MANRKAEREPGMQTKGASKEDAGRDLYHHVYLAILEHRLPPGTKLGEDKLANIFDVSRARVREILARLSHEGIVELVPQKGAHVARPSPKQARDVMEMRRQIEPGIVRRLIASLDSDKQRRLEDHLEAEALARRENDSHMIIRLSGDFHFLLGELCGNEFYARSIRELSTLTCLIIYLYDAPTSDACRDDEHRLIVNAIVDRDPDRAAGLVVTHLDHIEASLDLNEEEKAVDIEDVFSSLRVRSPAARDSGKAVPKSSASRRS